MLKRELQERYFYLFDLSGDSFCILQVLCAKERDPNLQGVITHSSGNHGQALSWAASEVGVECCVVLPKDTPKSQIDAIKGYGAEIVMCEPTQQSRYNSFYLCKFIEELFQSYLSLTLAKVSVMAQPLWFTGTIALELLQQVKSLDAILVHGYEGGMAAGICLYAKAVKPDIKALDATSSVSSLLCKKET
ncbi:hypothetical protein KUTeg_009363 [Tegillarca granosa]|uniref:Tryptophan synthase beta chain-like PALP domain-containing protein n=1 Tax=Tegillarca granosa TaxID=220873 RepID=A0ABQ9F3L8_TEGGR|nr:hypothetical protein KUTeg_009363 [Tegillarca granosa]